MMPRNADGKGGASGKVKDDLPGSGAPAHTADDALDMKVGKGDNGGADVDVKDTSHAAPAQTTHVPKNLPDHNPALLTKDELDEVYKTKDYLITKYGNLDAETLDFIDNTVHRHNLEVNPPLRQAYEKEVYNLKETVVEMRVAGKSWEEIANVVSPLRREIGIEYKDWTSPELLEVQFSHYRRG